MKESLDIIKGKITDNLRDDYFKEHVVLPKAFYLIVEDNSIKFFDYTEVVKNNNELKSYMLYEENLLFNNKDDVWRDTILSATPYSIITTYKNIFNKRILFDIELHIRILSYHYGFQFDVDKILNCYKKNIAHIQKILLKEGEFLDDTNIVIFLSEDLKSYREAFKTYVCRKAILSCYGEDEYDLSGVTYEELCLLSYLSKVDNECLLDILEVQEVSDNLFKKVEIIEDTVDKMLSYLKDDLDTFSDKARGRALVYDRVFCFACSPIKNNDVKLSFSNDVSLFLLNKRFFSLYYLVNNNNKLPDNIKNIIFEIYNQVFMKCNDVYLISDIVKNNLDEIDRL